MPVPTTPAAWKRFVTDDNPEAKIIVADPGRPYPDDQPVVTETHWIMPARWLRPAIGATLLAAIAIAVALVLPGAIAASNSPEPSLAPLPSVPGELGVHLEELDEAVTG